MESIEMQGCTAFVGSRLVGSGSLKDAALAAREAMDAGDDGVALIFDDATGRQVEADLRGSVADVSARFEVTEKRSPGRPKLGVVGREVTLLPRHWEWLNSQSGGASVALRKLVEQARRDNEAADRRRAAQDAVYRFALAMAGNEPGFEEATRALYAGDRARFVEQTESWPHDVRDHARMLADAVLDA